MIRIVFKFLDRFFTMLVFGVHEIHSHILFFKSTLIQHIVGSLVRAILKQKRFLLIRAFTELTGNYSNYEFKVCEIQGGSLRFG